MGIEEIAVLEEILSSIVKCNSKKSFDKYYNIITKLNPKSKFIKNNLEYVTPKSDKMSIERSTGDIVQWINCLSDDNFSEVLVSSDEALLIKIKNLYESKSLEKSKANIWEDWNSDGFKIKENDELMKLIEDINKSLDEKHTNICELNEKITNIDKNQVILELSRRITDIENKIKLFDDLNGKIIENETKIGSFEELIKKWGLLTGRSTNNDSSGIQFYETSLGQNTVYLEQGNNYFMNKAMTELFEKELIKKQFKKIAKVIDVKNCKVVYDSLNQNQKLPSVEAKTTLVVLDEKGETFALYSKLPNKSYLNPPKDNQLYFFKKGESKPQRIYGNHFIFIDERNREITIGNDTTKLIIKDDLKIRNVEKILYFLPSQTIKIKRIIIYAPVAIDVNFKDYECAPSKLYFDEITKPIPLNNYEIDISGNDQIEINTKLIEIKNCFTNKSTYDSFEFLIQMSDKLFGFIVTNVSLYFIEFVDIKVSVDKKVQSKKMCYKCENAHFNEGTDGNEEELVGYQGISFSKPGFYVTTPLFSISDQLLCTNYTFICRKFFTTVPSDSIFLSEINRQRISRMLLRVNPKHD